MTEFAINASISATTGYAPFELNHGYLPSMIKELRSDSIAPKGIKDFAENALRNLAEAHDSIIAARVWQTKYANDKRREESQVNIGDLVYLATGNLNLPQGRAKKLCPKYIGPYKVIKARPETSNYTVELPPALQQRRINPTFHISRLKPYNASNDALFPDRTKPEPYDFGIDKEHEWFVDEIIGHRKNSSGKYEFEVRWSLGDTTWEPHDSCKDLAALERYLELHGVTQVKQLPKRKQVTSE
jgi:hypothetical protein